MRTALSTHDAPGQSAAECLSTALRASWARQGGTRSVALACSGGRDSLLLAVLLQALLPGRLRLLHVDHGLQADSGQWAQGLVRWAQARSLPVRVLPVQVTPGANLEQAARQARHAALQAALQPGEVLAMAHHQQDQAETVLMRLRSGAGTRGLAAMREWEPRRTGVWFWRPWLDQPRQRITAAAQALGLDWVDDPANQDPRFDRVWLRHTIWPVLEARWPAMQAGLAQTALWMQDAEQVFAEVLDQWRPRVQRVDGALSLQALQGASPALQRLILRDWLQGGASLPPPRTLIQGLQQWVQQPLRADAQPRMQWQAPAGPVEVRRHRGHLYRLPLPLRLPKPQYWTLGERGRIEAGVGVLVYQRCAGPPEAASLQVQLRSPIPGERVHVQGRVGHWPLKKWLQQQDIPPWQRGQVLLLQRADPAAAGPVLAILAPSGLHWTVQGAALLQDWQWHWQFLTDQQHRE